MIEAIRYEVLDALPTYGDMYIPVTEDGSSYYSEGLPIRLFKSDASSWVANFKPGWTRFKGVFDLSASKNLMVIAYGTCYIVDPEQTKPIAAFGVGYSDVLKMDDGRFVLQDQTDLTIVEADSKYWHTERISWDGLKVLKAVGSVITGLSYTPMGEWTEFSYDLDKRILTNGSY